MYEPDNPVSQTDLIHDLARLEHQGADAVDVVVFEDIRDMGAPLPLSESAREHIFMLAVNDLYCQLAPEQARTAP